MLTLTKNAVADHGEWNRAAHSFLQAIAAGLAATAGLLRECPEQPDAEARTALDDELQAITRACQCMAQANSPAETLPATAGPLRLAPSCGGASLSEARSRVGEHFKAAREAAGISLEDATKRLRCDRLPAIEKSKGISLVPVHVVIEAAVFYDVSADYLLGLADIWPDTSTTATTDQE